MAGLSWFAERRAFSEADYTELYPDIRASIEAGNIPSGWAHYDRHGREEGRVLCRFDEQFYLRAYPLVATELTRGARRDAAGALRAVWPRARLSATCKGSACRQCGRDALNVRWPVDRCT